MIRKFLIVLGLAILFFQIILFFFGIHHGIFIFITISLVFIITCIGAILEKEPILTYAWMGYFAFFFAILVMFQFILQVEITSIPLKIGK